MKHKNKRHQQKASVDKRDLGPKIEPWYIPMVKGEKGKKGKEKKKTKQQQQKQVKKTGKEWLVK